MAKVNGRIEKIGIVQKKVGEALMPTLILNVEIPITKKQVVEDMYAVFQQSLQMIFEPLQGSLDLDSE